MSTAAPTTSRSGIRRHPTRAVAILVFVTVAAAGLFWSVSGQSEGEANFSFRSVDAGIRVSTGTTASPIVVQVELHTKEEQNLRVGSRQEAVSQREPRFVVSSNMDKGHAPLDVGAHMRQQDIVAAVFMGVPEHRRVDFGERVNIHRKTPHPFPHPKAGENHNNDALERCCTFHRDYDSLPVHIFDKSLWCDTFWRVLGLSGRPRVLPTVEQGGPADEREADPCVYSFPPSLVSEVERYYSDPSLPVPRCGEYAAGVGEGLASPLPAPATIVRPPLNSTTPEEDRAYLNFIVDLEARTAKPAVLPEPSLEYPHNASESAARRALRTHLRTDGLNTLRSYVSIWRGDKDPESYFRKNNGRAPDHQRPPASLANPVAIRPAPVGTIANAIASGADDNLDPNERSYRDEHYQMIMKLATAFHIYDRNPMSVTAIPTYTVSCVASDCHMLHYHIDRVFTLGIGYFTFTVSGVLPKYRRIGMLLQRAFPSRFMYIAEEKHLGCAGAWNRVYRLMYYNNPHPVPFIYVANMDLYQTIEAAEKYLNYVYDTIADPKLGANVLLRFMHYSLYSYTYNAWRYLGYWDEGMYPAFGEDNEFEYRAVFLGLYTPTYRWLRDQDFFHGSKTSLKDNTVREMFERWNPQHYLRQKWNIEKGGRALFRLTPEERLLLFKTPFGIPDVPIRNSFVVDEEHNECVRTGVGERYAQGSPHCVYSAYGIRYLRPNFTELPAEKLVKTLWETPRLRLPTSEEAAAYAANGAIPSRDAVARRPAFRSLRRR